MTSHDTTGNNRNGQTCANGAENLEQLELFFSQSIDGCFFMMIDEPVRWDDTVDKDAVLDYVFEHQRITRVNHAMLEQYHTTEEEFLGLRPYDFFAHDIEYGKKVWLDFFDDGKLHIDTDERKFDGTPMWVEGNYTCLYDSEGRIRGHFGIQREVTERVEAQRALQFRVDFETLITSISARFINIPVDDIDSCITKALGEIGRFARVDRSYIFRFSPDSKTITNTHEWCGDGIEPQIDMLANVSLADDLPWFNNRLMNRKIIQIDRVEELPPEAQKDKFHFESQSIKSLIVVPMVYGGDLHGFLGFDAVQNEKHWPADQSSLLMIVGEVFINALERKRMEKQIVENEERLRKITTSASDAIFMIDEAGTISFWNESAERIFECSAESAVGESFRRFLHVPESSESLQDILFAPMNALNGSAQDTVIEVRGFRADGSDFPVEISFSPALIQESRHVICIARDISLRKDFEEKIERLRHEYEAFMRHELKNILTPIKGFSDIILMSLPPDFSEKHLSFLKRINDSSDAAISLIDRLKHLQDIENGAYMLEKTGIDFAPFLETRIFELSLAARECDVRISFENLAENTHVSVDMDLMKGAVANIVKNAVEHVCDHPDSAERNVKVILFNEKDHVCISVKNRGKPIPPEKQATFFEKFNSDRTMKKDGTGLGTTYAALVARAHGGSIGVSSNERDGTTVTMELPPG